MTEIKDHIYPEKKVRDLSEREKAEIRALIDQGSLDTYQIAEKFGCSSSQIAAIKANLKR